MKDRPFGRVGEGAALPSFMRGERYLKLLQDYVYGRMSVTELQAVWRQLYLHGPDAHRPDLSDEVERVLHEMFAALDSFTTDRSVIAEDPEFFVTEKDVREKAILTLQRLRLLNRSPS